MSALTPQDRAAKKRKAAPWQPPQVPRLTDLFGGPEARARLSTYWRGPGPADLADRILFPLSKIVPVRLASWSGGFFARRVAMRAYPRMVARTLTNLAVIRPELDDAARMQLAVSHFDNLGRFYAEFALLERLWRTGRISWENSDAFLAANAKGPIVLVGMHLTNWEIAAPIMQHLGVNIGAVIAPPPRASQVHFAQMVRSRFGLKMFPPGVAGTRPAVRLLKEGGIVSIYCDEEHGGRLMAPFFGRPPHLDGNLAVAARLARMTGATVMLYHCARLGGGRYHLTFENPILLPSQTDADAPLLEDVKALNAAMEPIVRPRCGTWYFLDKPFYEA